MVHWNEKNGKTYYDANGKKKSGGIESAKFNKGADLAADNLLIA